MSNDALKSLVPVGMSEAECERLMATVYEITDVIRKHTLSEQAIIIEVCSQAIKQVQRDYSGATAGVPIQ